MKVLVSMLKWGFIAIALGSTSFTGYANTAIRVGLNNWCPHVCVPTMNEPDKGYTSDILITILKDAGYEVELVSAPFMRLVNMAQSGEIDIIGSIYPEEAPFLTFSQNATGIAEEVFFVNLDDNWLYFSIGSLEEKARIGLIKGAGYSNAEFHQYVASNPNRFDVISGINIVPRQIKMLIAGRFNTFVGYRFVVQYFANKLALSKEIKSAGILSQRNFLYAGVSPTHPEVDWLVSIIDVGIIRLRTSGELSKIMTKYGLEDWKR